MDDLKQLNRNSSLLIISTDGVPTFILLCICLSSFKDPLLP